MSQNTCELFAFRRQPAAIWVVGVLEAPSTMGATVNVDIDRCPVAASANPDRGVHLSFAFFASHVYSHVSLVD